MTRDLVMDIADFTDRLGELRQSLNLAIEEGDIDRALIIVHELLTFMEESRKTVLLNMQEG